ncbi:DUF2935 domain-containing protein [Alkalibaculum sp. M08DMB]|uniref:DUF2935 domain-containing protein n=1 Tax=Alkalibaculum sporogenes TaxID=2655001 RepID=A0A6A7K995_9FIRM|nr:DUF2935 domain-containing protein [Alkalibaculum sporogenes]MPW25683.1 DUF2935 domain-containing protein [Alkalibaculum sporogenes]
MANQIPVMNYILHIVNDTCYWVNISIEHLVILNELLKEKEVDVDHMVIDELNSIYISMEQSIKKLDDIEQKARYGEDHVEFIMNLCLSTLNVLQQISGIQVQLIQVLGKLEKLKIKSLYLLMLSHITLEERYSLELLSSNINTITGLGFYPALTGSKTSVSI